MDLIKPSPAPKKTKLARAIAKVINLQTVTRNSKNYVPRLKSQGKVKEGSMKSRPFDQDGDTKFRNRAAMEAFVAKLFAGISSIKAAYAELQIAQFPYNSDAIQSADEAVVNELKALSELKQCFLKKQIDLSPQVTLLLAEIQEQQSLMKTYEITLTKMESEVQFKDSDISSLEKQLDVSLTTNKSMEKRLNSSGSLSVPFSVRISDLNPTHFVQVLHYTLRSVRSFVKLMIQEMESAHWDLAAAANSIEPDAVFVNPNDSCFAFESFVCRVMFENFNDPNFSLPNESLPHCHYFFDEFKRLKSINPKHFFSQNPHSMLGKFIRYKYLNLVHPKMECSFFGNLNQRSVVNRSECPDSAFFTAFAEMAKRVWVLHCLGFSFDCGVCVFQVRKNCRFSEVFMECVTEHVFVSSYDDPRVSFTVVPGFKIGKSAIQCQVYLSPASS